MEKQYDIKKYELKINELWNIQQIYKASHDKPIYSIDTPPPTVSGSLHIGHIF